MRIFKNLQFFDLAESIPAFLIEGVTFCGREMIPEMEKSFIEVTSIDFL